MGARGASIIGLLLLLGSMVPATQAQTSSFITNVLVTVNADRSEAITWHVQASGAYPAGITVPPNATIGSISSTSGIVRHHETSEPSGQQVIQFDGQYYDVTASFARSGPTDSLHPLYNDSLWVSGYQSAQNTININVQVPTGYQIIYSSAGQTSPDETRLSYSTQRDGDLAFAYLAPLDPTTGIKEIDDGIYRIFGPASSQQTIRAIADIANNATALAAKQAGITLPATIYVRFAPDEFFSWEEGYYNERGIITIRKADLTLGAGHGFPWSAAETLTHETFHRVSVPSGFGFFNDSTAWWVEGAAVNAQRFVSGSGGWQSCDSSYCWTFQRQLSLDQLEAAYSTGWPFLPSWTPHMNQTPDTRDFYYKYSGFLVGAFIQRFGEPAYRAVWADVEAAAADGTRCPCDDDFLLRAAVKESGGQLTSAELYYPLKELYHDDRPRFESTIASLLADPSPPTRSTPSPDAIGPPPSTQSPSSSQSPPPTPPPAQPNATLTQTNAAGPAERYVKIDRPAAQRLKYTGSLAVNFEGFNFSGPDKDSRLEVLIDGVPAEPSLGIDAGTVHLGLAHLVQGQHIILVEATGLDGTSFSPSVKDSVVVDTSIVFRLQIVSEALTAEGDRYLLTVKLTDRTDGPPIVGQAVTVRMPNGIILEEPTNDFGLTTFTVDAAEPGSSSFPSIEVVTMTPEGYPHVLASVVDANPPVRIEAAASSPAAVVEAPASPGYGPLAGAAVGLVVILGVAILVAGKRRRGRTSKAGTVAVPLGRSDAPEPREPRSALVAGANYAPVVQCPTSPDGNHHFSRVVMRRGTVEEEWFVCDHCRYPTRL